MQVPKISKGALIRTIVLFVMLINGVMAMLGHQVLPVGEAEVEGAVNAVYAAVSAIGMIVAALAAWWKDNDFTKKSRIAKEQVKTQVK